MSVSLNPELLLSVSRRRKIKHWAKCDICEQFIYDVRYNCIDCANWDCCSDCLVGADNAHPGHTLKPYFCPKWNGFEFEKIYQIFPFAGQIKHLHNRHDIERTPEHTSRSYSPRRTYIFPSITGTARLCVSCAALFAENSPFDDIDVEERPERKHQVHPAATDIEIAASIGCALCALLWQQFGLILGVSTSQVLVSVRKESLNFFLDRPDRTDELMSLGLIWHERPSEEQSAAYDRSHTFLGRLKNDEGRYSFLESRKTGDTAVLDLAKAWYDDCCKNHPACKALTNFENSRAQWNPSRLLDVGAVPDENVLRLIETDTLTVAVQYAALSHCWGQNQHLRLLQRNRENFMARIDPDSLSKTFSDAIEVARFLGMRYIWIDSLCILQDSKEDWEAESALMGQVYRHCECCIAATAASDGKFGCFVERDWRVLEPLKVSRAGPFKIENLGASKSEKKTGPGYYEILDHHLWENEIENGALTNRGWAFQERALSHRILHFGRSQIFWECRQRIACESYPTEMPLCMRVPWREELVPRTERAGSFAFLAQDVDQTPRQHAYKFWQNSLEFFAERLLTMEVDKLPAVSGVAKHVQQAAKDEYLAGLWRGNIERDLLWRLENRKTPPDKWRAPTWSWASRNGSLNLWRNYSFQAWSDIPDEPEKEELMSVIWGSATPVGQDPTGQVSEGHILLFGQLAPAFIKCTNRKVDSKGGICWNDISLHVLLQDGKLEKISDNSNCFPDEPVEDEEVLVYCLPVINFGGDFEAFMIGLLLKPYDEIEFPGVFYRYGIFQTLGGDANRRLWSSTTWWGTQVKNFGQPYAEEDGSRAFLIYLV